MKIIYICEDYWLKSWDLLWQVRKMLAKLFSPFCMTRALTVISLFRRLWKLQKICLHETQSVSIRLPVNIVMPISLRSYFRTIVCYQLSSSSQVLVFSYCCFSIIWSYSFFLQVCFKILFAMTIFTSCYENRSLQWTFQSHALLTASSPCSPHQFVIKIISE